MRLGWLKAFGALTRPVQSTGRHITNFGIGVCPGCRGLRGVASAQCVYCDSTAPVAEDA